MTKFNEGIDPTLPLAVYMWKQETCQEFAQDANVPISEELMVTTGTKHALQCSGLTQAWCEWRRLPAIQHTWLNWKAHWTAAFKEQRDISQLNGGTIMLHANAAVDNVQRLSQMLLQIITSLNNLANTAVQKNDTVETLVVTNKQLTDTITKAQETTQNSSQSSKKWQDTIHAGLNNKTPHPNGTPKGIVTPMATK
ncbi:hypothetical protein ACHAW6_001085 [Cyclotella cf. meneghiniana]